MFLQRHIRRHRRFYFHIQCPAMTGIECIDFVSRQFAVLHIPMDDLESPMNFSYYTYSAIPKLYSLLDTDSMEASGILPASRIPAFGNQGQGVLIGFVDTGIDYQNPLFRKEDGSSRILGIWDQTLETGVLDPVNGFQALYGTQYSREEIDQALAAPDPLALVPSADENGHGTFLASVAAGGEDPDQDFTGAAPKASIAMVKLKPAKEYLRDFYLIREGADAYQENDIMMGVAYLLHLARRFSMPLVICLGLGTSFGSHSGVSLFSEYLQRIARSVSQAVVIGGGNEGNTAGHFRGRLTENQQQVELRVGEGVTGFTAELWGSKPSVFRLAVRSPGGEQLPEVEFGLGSTVEYTFVYEKTRIQITDTANERNTGDQLMLIRFTAPSPGVWTFLIRGARVFPESIFDIWLAPQQFRSGELFFLVPDPDVTLTVPSYTTDAVTVTFYNSENGSFYYRSGRGFGRTGEIKPDLAAPGVEISTVNGPYSGSSMAAALTAGACAQLMQWCVAENNYPRISGRGIQTFLSRGAREQTQEEYPSRRWGYGQLDMRRTFDEIAGNYPE